MIKQLVTHSNSKTAIIDKALLQVAGLIANTAFPITVNPNVLAIQSVGEETPAEKFWQAVSKRIKSKHHLRNSLAYK